MATFVPTGAMMPSLKGAVEVDADSVTSGSRVLVCQRENKGRVIAKANSALAYAQAALWLAEKHHIWWKWEVMVVLQRVAAEELRGLGHTVTTWLPGGEKDNIGFVLKEAVVLRPS